jgi:hypothetical protein
MIPIDDIKKYIYFKVTKLHLLCNSTTIDSALRYVKSKQEQQDKQTSNNDSDSQSTTTTTETEEGKQKQTVF